MSPSIVKSPPGEILPAIAALFSPFYILFSYDSSLKMYFWKLHILHLNKKRLFNPNRVSLIRSMSIRGNPQGLLFAIILIAVHSLEYK